MRSGITSYQGRLVEDPENDAAGEVRSMAKNQESGEFNENKQAKGSCTYRRIPGALLVPEIPLPEFISEWTSGR